MWHIPDEQAHFAQAQNLVSSTWYQIPGTGTSEDIVISEKKLGTYRVGGNNLFTYHPENRIEYVGGILGKYEQEIESLPIENRGIFSINEATGYPPLYYWYIAIVNKIFWSQGLIFRVYISRVATVILSTLGVYLSYILFRQFFFSKQMAIAAAGLVSFHPMWRFVSSGVTSDAMMNTFYPVGLIALIRYRRYPSLARLIILMMTIVGLMLVKTQSVFLLLLVIPIVLITLIKDSRPSRLHKIIAWTAIVMIFIMVLAMIIRHTFLIVDTLFWKSALLWGIAFPEISSFSLMRSEPGIINYLTITFSELYRQGFPWYWGVYRWLSLTLPLTIYRIIKIIIGLSILGWIVGITKHRVVSLVKNISTLKIIFLSSLIYAAGILGWNLLFWRSHGYSFGLQGRYFFPNLPEHMVIIFIGLLVGIPVIYRKLVSIVVIFVMLIFNWYSLWFVASSYYDSSNLNIFLLEASQYKPWFIKTPMLPAIIALGIASCGWFLWRLGVEYFKEEGKRKKEEGEN